MSLIATPEPATIPVAAATSRPIRALTLLCGLWFALFFASLFSPPVLDDADGTHANAARQMLLSGDWVTMRVNNVRYLEKAPLPYWIAALSLRLFGLNAFAVHLPQALAVLGLMLLGFHWAREAFGERAALYTGLAVLTSAGVFLFTRVLIPDPLLSLLLALALYCFLQSLSPASPHKAVILSGARSAQSKDPDEDHTASIARTFPTTKAGAPHLASEMWDVAPQNSPIYPYALWTALALAVLTKGLVALVFLFGTAALYLALTGHYRHWRRLRPVSGTLVLLAIAAPWHILAGLRNTGGMDGHGFFWFYFINEHVLRFLGHRIPRDYNKLPSALYWALHLVWLFPWSLFAPLLAIPILRRLSGRLPLAPSPSSFAARTTLLLALFSALVLVFFSISTNQEYYTFPAYLPLLMLLAAALARAEQGAELTTHNSQLTTVSLAHAAFTAIGLAISLALAYGLWISRHLAFVPDIGSLLAHRGVGDYTLSMSSLFDLTGPSFAALRLPATLALATLSVGPALAWLLRAQRRHLAATTTLAMTSAAFLVAAHIALARFAPMLSSEDMAATIQQLESSGRVAPQSTLLLFGDQAYGSSIPFYLNRPLSQPALLVDGRSSSMLFGSTFPDAQALFLTQSQLLTQWGNGPRKLLFVPPDRRDQADQLLGTRAVLLKETSGKALYTDRPLDPAAPDSQPNKARTP